MVAGAIDVLDIFNKNRDRVYCPLPLYHTAAGMIGVSTAIVNGGTLVLRKKFSASNFWKDCIKYECTVSCLAL